MQWSTLLIIRVSIIREKDPIILKLKGELEKMVTRFSKKKKKYNHNK